MFDSLARIAPSGLKSQSEPAFGLVAFPRSKASPAFPTWLSESFQWPREFRLPSSMADLMSRPYLLLYARRLSPFWSDVLSEHTARLSTSRRNGYPFRCAEHRGHKTNPRDGG